MPVYLPDNVKTQLPVATDINASLLMTKYAVVKGACENEQSAEFVKRVCQGRSKMPPFSYTEIHGSVFVLMQLGSRMMVDQSGGVADHASLCLHPHFGFPYIPGSAVKGCTRHHVWTLWDESEDEQEKKDYAQDIVAVFGYPTGDEALDKWCEVKLSEIVINPKTGKRRVLSGRVAFFAAYPEEKTTLEPDVLTPHHRKYYTDEAIEYATDDEAPVPVFFPAVKSGGVFEFVLRPLCAKDAPLAEKALNYLKSALEIEGIGGKSSAGYGWFSYDEVKTKLVRDREKLLRQRKEEALQKANEARKKAAAIEAERIEKENVDGLSDAEKADYLIGKWNEGKWLAVLGSSAEFKKLDVKTAEAVVRHLASTGVQRWIDLKNAAQNGKGKTKKEASQIVQDIYPIAKNQQPRIKMP
jgi:CRISPR-associated protein Cmr6